MSSGRVLGVDGCVAGWVGVAIADQEVRAYAAQDVAELADAAAADGPIDVIAIDIPIGLPDSGRRNADVLARRQAGPRWASVFMTPVRTAVQAHSYEAAAAENRTKAGQGISRHAYALSAKIIQVDGWIRGALRNVVEVHPELSFAEMAGAPLPVSKSTWAGAALRRQLLAEAGIIVPDDLGDAGSRSGVDDVLDAAAAAWTARRVSLGLAARLPDPPQVFSDGLACAIWI